jgi:hypothetical protein
MAPRGFPVARRPPIDVEKLAWAVRQQIAPEVDANAYVSGLRLLEQFHHRKVTVRIGDRTYPVTYDVMELTPGVEAEATFCAATERAVIRMSLKTYEELGKDWGRARFSLYHELGHVFMHGAELAEQHRIRNAEAALRRGQVFRHHRYCDTEWQSNWFSAAFLAPAKGLLQLERSGVELTGQLVSEMFGMGPTSAGYRITNYASIRDELSQLWPERDGGGRG